ncbi:MAG: lipoate protein ligase C-terminal domain-containing protein [Candidatus Asgardarchaeia archaeon]
MRGRVCNVFVEHKVVSGKLLKISVVFDISSGEIKELKIFGDFFMYPEDALEEMENLLVGTKPEYDTIIEKIRKVINEKDVVMIGISEEDIAHTLLRAFSIFREKYQRAF